MRGSARHFLPRHSARGWSIRIALALGVAAIGIWSVAQSLAYSMRGDAPELAHQLAPGDGRITAILSEKLSAPEARTAGRNAADRLARLALRQDAMAVPAVATLGIDAQIRGNTNDARHFFAYAQKLSRRDLRTQLWALEDAVGRGDVAGALRQSDITLRASLYGPDLLCPGLSAAVADPAIRGPLIRLLATKPAWGQPFVEYAANTAEPRATFSLLMGLRRVGMAVPPDANAALIDNLLKGSFYDEAWNYYTSTTPRADRHRSRDPRFSAIKEKPSLLDWKTVDSDGIVASLQPENTGGAFDFSAPASVGGPVLRQAQLLPAGSYDLTGHSVSINQPADSQPYWLLACADGRELGRATVPNSAQNGGKFIGRFVVPAGCPMQYLSLIARPSDMVGGTSGQIDQVQLAPTR